MRITGLAVLGSFVAGVALAEDEKAWIDARDLVPEKAARLRPDAPVSPRPVGIDAKSRVIAGEDRFLFVVNEGEPTVWLDGDSLLGALAAIAPDAGDAVEFDGATGRVGCGEAKREAVTKALAELRARVPAPVAVRVCLTRDGATVLRAEGHVPAATSLVLADAVERSVVADYDVEVAQASSIGDPILATLRTGASAALCVTPMPDGRSAVVETVARFVAPLGDGTIDLGHPGFGAADRCETAFDELASCFRVENGKAATVSWTGREGGHMSLEIRATWTPAPTLGEPAVLVAPLVGSEFGGFHSIRAPEMHDDAESPDKVVAPSGRGFSRDVLLAAAFHDPDYVSKVLGAGHLLVLPAAGARSGAQQCERLCAAADALMASAVADCVAVNVPAGAQVAIDGPLPAGAVVVASYSGPIVVGLPACSTGGSERRFLADWDVEVAQSSRIPDPRIGQLATGHFLDLEVGRGSVTVHLDLRRLDRMDRRELQLAVGRASQGVQGDQTNGTVTDPMLPPERVAVEKPVVSETSVAAVVPLGPDGTGSLRRAGPALLGAGRELVVLVRVK